MADPPPVSAAASQVPPPLNKIKFTQTSGFLTLLGISFLTQLWASTNGDGGLVTIVQALKIQVAQLANTVAGLAGSIADLANQIAIIFNMHGDGTLSPTGQLTVTGTNGVPFAPSATIDTTDADNITSGTLDTLQLPLWLFQWVTIDDLPTPSPGLGVLCTDLGGGPGVLMGDGGAWRRTSAGLETQAPAATLTLQVLTNAEEQLQTAALTANMVVTLENDLFCYPGARFRWVRAGVGAFTLVFKDSMSGATLYTSAVSTSETVEFLYTGLAWVLAQHSAL